MTTTPPLLTVQEPPPTPLHGSRIDLRNPHSVRRSPRFAQPHTSNRTPSPGAAASDHSPQTLTSATPRRKLPSQRVQRGSPGYSPPSSPISPPRMQRSKAPGSRAKKLEPPANPPTSMLPTPVKTPRKKEAKQTAKPAARVLFPHRPDTVEDAMPTPRKRGRQGLSLESFTENDGGHADIEIFTDSKDKVPEVDESADNPFYTKNGTSSSKKRKKSTPDHNKAVRAAIERDEGMVYVFRGKKIYKKFENFDDDKPEGGEVSLRGMPIEDLASPKPFTRASVKPKLLFGKTRASTGKEQAGSTSDEEAVTDIEETAVPAETPSKPEHATPATPPATLYRRVKIKRVMFYAGSSDEGSGNEAEEPERDDPRFSIKKARKASPFDGWQRTKTGPASTASSKGKKRAAADDLESDTSKRTKSQREAA